MKRIGIFAIIFTLLGLASYALHSNISKVSEEDQPVRKIDASTVELSADALANLETFTATVQDFQDLLSMMGRISPVENRVTAVPARVAGRIDAVHTSTGDLVQAGQVLAEEYSPDYVAAKEEYLEALLEDRTRVASQDLSSSAQSGTFSLDSFDLKAMTRKKLENMGLSAADIAGLSATAQTDGRLLIRTPRSGAIISQTAVVGNLQNVGDTLFTLADLSKVWFLGDLYAEDLAKVHSGMSVVINAVGMDKPVYGKISLISPVIDPTARTIKVRALVENQDLLLRADMYVQADVVLSRHPALLVPDAAILRVHNQYMCFRRISDSRFQEVALKLGKEANGMSEVISGLREGDLVISQGGMLLDQALVSDGE